MSFKKPYLAIALLGVAAASGAAWWLQNKPKAPGAEVSASAGNAPTSSQPAGSQVAAPGGPPGASSGATSGGAPGVGGPQRPPAVELAKVESVLLVDETQSVGPSKRNQ